MQQKPSSVLLSKFDYCNSVLSGSPIHLLDKLQKVQFSAARLVFKARKHEHLMNRNFTGYQYSQESSIIFLQSCNSVLQFFHWNSQSIFLNSWPSTIHPDNSAPFLTPEPSTYLSQKQRPLDNKPFLSRARHSGTHYHMMFVTQHQHLLSSNP